MLSDEFLKKYNYVYDCFEKLEVINSIDYDKVYYNIFNTIETSYNVDVRYSKIIGGCMIEYFWNWCAEQAYFEVTVYDYTTINIVKLKLYDKEDENGDFIGYSHYDIEVKFVNPSRIKKMLKAVKKALENINF